jgi:hypothetical protein
VAEFGRSVSIRLMEQSVTITNHERQAINRDTRQGGASSQIHTARDPAMSHADIEDAQVSSGALGDTGIGNQLSCRDREEQRCLGALHCA